VTNLGKEIPNNWMTAMSILQLRYVTICNLLCKKSTQSRNSDMKQLATLPSSLTTDSSCKYCRYDDMPLVTHPRHSHSCCCFMPSIMYLDNCTLAVSVSNILTASQSRLNLILNLLTRLMSCCLCLGRCLMSQAFATTRAMATLAKNDCFR